LISTGVTPTVSAGSNHHAILAQGLRRDHRCKLNHQTRSGIETAVTEDLVEGEIVEDLDQLWVGYRQRGDVTWKQFIVVLLCSLVWCHIEVLRNPSSSMKDGPKSRAAQVSD
jgi:hypothetical protein